MSMQVITDVTALQTCAESFVSQLISAPEGATVVALSGDLGVGKTTFVQAVAAALGVTTVVTSPTFVLQKTYATTDDRFSTLVHIDAYRLAGGQELARLDWATLCASSSHLICIEWPERVGDQLPSQTITLTFSERPDGGREIRVSN